ncbi:HEPN domain-containing protein [Lutimonas sp.]|uniref:HEPN domain-containing protein n=1 Tax=Lutimonas sp. TaxID=1872403 RepID=UPI003D9B2406
MDKKAKNHFKNADEHLKKANEELYKPKEDVVNFLVCKNTLFAIENFLKGFLSNRGYDTSHEEALDTLLDRCKLIDKKFNSINLSVIDCSSDHQNHTFCEDSKKVNACFQRADELDNLLRSMGIS